MSESTLSHLNKNIKRFTLVDTEGDSLVANAFNSLQVVAQKSTSTRAVAAQTAVGIAEGQISSAFSSRKRLMVQNTGTTVIKLVLGTDTVTQTAYHIALSACTAADDGTGASFIDEMWTGAVRAISSAAGGTCVITELT